MKPFPLLIATVAALALALTVACSHSTSSSAVTLGNQKLTVVVVVVDSLMVSDIGLQTPVLTSLIEQGTFYPESRAVFSAETIPNHVAMMTGVYPARNGIPANKFLDFSQENPVRTDLSIPEEMTAHTLFTWIRRQCVDQGVHPDIRTGATQSKKYLFEIFEGDAANPDRANRNPNVFNVQPDSYWNPQDSPFYIDSPDEHTPDIPTMNQALNQLPEVDFLFINLGDVDRSAHAGGELFRAAVLGDTDLMVDLLVTELKDTGRWDRTVMIIVSDHGMDYSTPGPLEAISTQSTLDALGACFTPMTAVANGGTNGIFVMDRSASLAERQAAVRAARQCIMGLSDCDSSCPGTSRPASAVNIDHAWYTVDDPLDPAGNMPTSLGAKHSNLGDLVLSAAQGYKFGEPSVSDPNAQIPGNHGHPATLHNFFLVTGGSPWIKKGQVIAPSAPSPGRLDKLPEQAENVDVAPTVAWLLGLNLKPSDFPDGQGFDGRILKEAFVQFEEHADAASPTVCGRFD
jgi:hypothetical protein